MTRSRQIWALAAGIVVLMGGCGSDDSVAANLPSNEADGSSARTDGVTGAAGSAGATAGMPATAGAMAGGEATSTAGTSGAEAGMAAGAEAGSGGMPDTTGVQAGSEGNAESPALDADCDMNGLWAVRLMSVVEALGLQQCGNLYYYMELRQEGADVEVVDQFNCSIEGRGTANSTFSDATIQAIMQLSSQVGRHGTMRKGDDGTCELQMEPFWAVFGVDEDSYAPDPRNADLTLSEVQSMTPMPTADGPGVIDVEGDGYPGMALIVTGALNGKRHAAQRNFQAWLTNDRYKITPSVDWPDDIEARADYIGEDITYQVEPPDNVLLAAGANPVRDAAAARVTLHFLGRDASDPRAGEIVVAADPAGDPAGTTQTCRNIVSALPPIVPLAFPNPQVCPCTGGGMCM